MLGNHPLVFYLETPAEARYRKHGMTATITGTKTALKSRPRCL